MPISAARFVRSSLVQSAYEPDLPPFFALDVRFELAIRAAFSLLAPWSRRASYCSGSLTLGPGLFCGDMTSGLPARCHLNPPRATAAPRFAGRGWPGKPSSEERNPVH